MISTILAILFILSLITWLFGAYVKYLIAAAIWIVGLPFAIIGGLIHSIKNK
ncbi:hypothetical protein [Latilactobacillus curvatus]|uniref:hypothetical protein n=1 Tax=Latilactobacillus curvatus TaxID=28038 RepID=UPI0020738846|nr:hypothetical protein [Latilactobacillus curvatus]